MKGEPSNCGKNRPVLFANFRGIFADLADFTDAKLDNGNFDEAKMSKAKFESTSTRGACFLKANLAEVDLKHVDGDFDKACVFNSKNFFEIKDDPKFKDSLKEDPDKRCDADKRSGADRSQEHGSWCKPWLPEELAKENEQLRGVIRNLTQGKLSLQ